ncbi:hypothetical protein POM88_028341 [Heracleum sosnowskyi]|uniref:Uncharacterized protein n=1 Tax=Heracleum sosnowskyi TaxID=360622 RepID=A0AAD8IBQ9_9APIA|nr:hypothetical protein POM88_028341 [Heracleum sosnowskyi]
MPKRPILFYCVGKLRWFLMTTDISTPLNTPYWLAPDAFDPEQIYRRTFKPIIAGETPNFDPFNPAKRFASSPSPSYSPGQPTPTIDPETSLWHGFSRTYPGDITKYHPFDPENFDPESFFFGGAPPSSSQPVKFDPSDPKLHPQDPELLDDMIDDQSSPKCVPVTSENYLPYGFSRTYVGDITKYHPFDPENFDPESFFFGGIIPSGEPAKLDPCDPPQDQELLDVSFDDQSSAGFDPLYPEIGVWDDFSPAYPGDPTKFYPFDPENFDAENFFLYGAYSLSGEPSKLDPHDHKIHPWDIKLLDLEDQSPDLKAKIDGCVEGFGEPKKPSDTHDKTVSDGWGNFKGNPTIVELSGTAANKWNKKESSSASKASGNPPGEEEAWGRVCEEFSRQTGLFARNCSLGADGGKSGGHGGGNIGKALCTRMP